jgi:hypothetical protein
MPIELFYSYSHRDEKLRDALETHLAILKRTDLIATWHFRKITAGKEWEKEINEHLDRADIVLFLVSADFMNSDYCWGVEVQRAMERHVSGRSRVIPIILKSCVWKEAPFGKLQVLPTGEKPLTKWRPRDEGLTDIATGIKDAAKELASKKACDVIERCAITPQPRTQEDVRTAHSTAAALQTGAAGVPGTRLHRLQVLSQAQQALRILAPHHWTVKFPGGSEHSRVDAEGKYYVDDKKYGYKLSGPPKYDLRQIQFETDKGKVVIRFVKVKPDGTERKPETLYVVNERELHGHAAGNQAYKLVYKRREES